MTLVAPARVRALVCPSEQTLPALERRPRRHSRHLGMSVKPRRLPNLSCELATHRIFEPSPLKVSEADAFVGV